MGLWEIYQGHQTWEEYLRNQSPLNDWTEITHLTSASDTTSTQPHTDAVAVGLSASDYQLALDSGLGALTLNTASEAKEFRLELESEKLAGGLARLNADFNLLLGDLIWKFEMSQETLNHLLQEIRLAEFEREARAYRWRAERAYLNGWYEEALSDFLEAEKRNYPDYAVHRSIATLYLYHLINLPRALEYFCKAAKYARPSDPRQAAEAHYFAATVCALEQHLEEGYEHLDEAVALNPELFEAHYQRAGFAVLLGRTEAAIASLEIAITGDPRYHERARHEAAFEPIRPQVQALLDRLLRPVQEKAAQLKQDAERLKNFIIVQPEEERLVQVFHQVEAQLATELNYQTGLRVLEKLTQVEQELSGIHDRYSKRHEMDPRDYVRSVAFSRDGRLLASGFLHGGIQVWDVASGLQVHSFLGHVASVNSVAFSPDGLWLASGSRDRAIRLWDVDLGTKAQTLRGHEGEVRAVTFSPDGQWLASGSHDRSIRLWRVATGHEANMLTGHTAQVTATVFSPDGHLLASGGWDRLIKLWDVAAGREIRTLNGHAKGVAALAFSPDGRWLASGSENGEVKLWNVAKGRPVKILKGHRNSVNSIAFSADGSLLAAGSLGQMIIIWKLATGDVVKHVCYADVSYNSVAFSPTGQWLAFGSRDLQLWLKVILTQEEYAAVKAGEARARQAKRQMEEAQLPTYISIHRAVKKR